MGGLWTGERVEDVPRQVRMRIRRERSRPANGRDPGGWHSDAAIGDGGRRGFPSPLGSSELQVRCGAIDGAQGGDETKQVVIELQRADGTIHRVWRESTTARDVSMSEFAAVPGKTHPQAGKAR
jgi:hypothetical protein